MFFKKNLHLKKLQRKRVAEGRNLTKGLRLDRNEKVDVWPQNFLRDALRGKPSSFFSTYPEISNLYKKIAVTALRVCSFRRGKRVGIEFSICVCFCCLLF